jgi:alpha-N-arabinofuranosidase
MREVGRRMNGLSLHYYCGTGRKSRSATKYEEDDWFHLMKSALKMEELVSKHSAIMDKYDAEKRIGLMVDEWGTWHAVEPGTNPGFLYQQNTIRDALVAGLTLNIFNQHADRVRMANIAQVVNVLQAMVLTDGPRILLTPTYHVFEMYSVHQESKLLPAEVESADYAFGDAKIPTLSVSASRDKAGVIHVTLCNLNPNAEAQVACDLQGAKPTTVSGRVLTAPEITAHNTFDKTDVVQPAEFKGASLGANGLSVMLPPKSVVALRLN